MMMMAGECVADIQCVAREVSLCYGSRRSAETSCHKRSILPTSSWLQPNWTVADSSRHL